MKFLINQDLDYSGYFDTDPIDSTDFIDFSEDQYAFEYYSIYNDYCFYINSSSTSESDESSEDTNDSLEEYKENKINNFYSFILYNYELKIKKKRKVFNYIKKGVTKNEKKNSLKRDINNLLLNQFFNVSLKNGDKIKFFNHFSIFVENFFLILKSTNSEFTDYKDYNTFLYLYNSNPDYKNFFVLFDNYIKNFEPIFDIKVLKKNKKNKNLNLPAYNINYIPKQKRLKNVLKTLSLYTEYFKNYSLWERLFWSFLVLFFDPKKTLMYKRKVYIYQKSIKYFKKSK